MAIIIQDGRREERVPQNKTGVIRFGAAGYQRSCTVVDLTSHGASITIASAFGVPDVFQLTINGEKETRQCRVIWSQVKTLGVSFE
jgi:hypothetical protein